MAVGGNLPEAISSRKRRVAVLGSVSSSQKSLVEAFVLGLGPRLRPERA